MIRDPKQNEIHLLIHCILYTVFLCEDKIIFSDIKCTNLVFKNI